MKIVCSLSFVLDKEEQVVVYCNRKLGDSGLGLYKVIRSSSSSSLSPPPSRPHKAGVSGACKFVTVSWIHVKAAPARPTRLQRDGRGHLGRAAFQGGRGKGV